MASRLGPPHRLARSNWREQAKRTADQLPEELEKREVLSVEAPPWIEERQRWTAFPKLMGENRSDNSVEKAVNTINDNCPEFVIYTDGSAAEGTRDGGSAVVVTTGDPREPEVVQEIKIRGRTLTSSYEEEREALQEAAKWIETNTRAGNNKVMICTDSQSLVEAISNSSKDTENIRSSLNRAGAHTIIQWVPGHVSIPGNEMADKLANEAANSREEEPIPFSLSCAKSCIKRTMKDGDPSHHRIAAVYSNHSRVRDKEATKTRKDAVLLARLRSGHCMAFSAYKNLMDPMIDPSCRRCNQDRDTIEHWLDCPGTAATRQELFGTINADLGFLTRYPNETLTLAARTLPKSIPR